MLKLIVGLGNPGEQYQKTRHNAGFWLLDQTAQDYSCRLRTEKKFFAEFGEIAINQQKIFLLKPQTFMNASGKSLAAVCRFYHIEPQQILIIHDELDLPEGKIKLKKSGGHGGHNGLRDIIAALASQDFYRLRIGIGRPENSTQVIDYVLKAPSATHMERLNESLSYGKKAIEKLITEGDEKAMHWLHSL
ncbi:aminoacyl-tRNA hydrolase [Dichelobacter nodosus]|uniref:Peptidyl-tRNA hydrolase n=1 Tax=Dichelobacter nodosus (strain VCS1703A) TaxID=246195 RepID=PTH_DICNV|nr:aminoacyl-tRNA hydrolase [Dichelobacter nodosus]A5EWU9.1 RecName: Full=Peptidyl-tRNA hydrolase; Short=PTH [Dichelobacter nodosus VCS1703A]ABQ13985.1 peptidyl-tRNA hydrolase [Dichelobacter nodosus VCS1703A]AXM45002.1 aminoacyl-tRNA hydrolase [Dichelobacter nodosus]KNZ39692.1 peptidyl-tRNA hydrolase [Dichelobacter nodosus]TGA65848.1 aminoacyl-tRNA hydrolase [Dichelobacter nodosus]